MNRAARYAIPIALGLALSAGLAAGHPPPGPELELKPKIKVSIDPEEIIKMYDHLTIKETRDWWRKYPTNEAEAKQALSDVGNAMKLMDESTQLFNAREIDRARQKMTECLASFHRVFVEDSLLLSDVYGVFGIMLSQSSDVVGADEMFRRQRASVEKAFPFSRFPEGHQRLALALLTMGTGQLDLGRHAAAEKMFRDALKMYEKHGSVNPNGSDLTTLYIQLTSAVFARREFVEAKDLAEKALKRCEELCKSPDGRAEYGHQLAKAMNNLAEVLRATGDTSGRADQLFKDSIALSGPIGSGIKLRNQAEQALGRGEWNLALTLSEDALRAAEKVYPESQFRNGSPELITVLRTRGSALTAVGERVAAAQAIERCLKMVRVIFPDDKCPDGHPELASTLLALGDVQLRSTRPEDQRAAAQMFRESLAVSLGHTRAQAAYLAESEMLQQLDTAGGAIDRLLSVPRPFDSRDYWYLWETKAAVMRIMDHRRRTALSSSDPAVRELVTQLQVARQALAANALAPTTEAGGVSASPADLTRRKEELESRLYAALHLPLPPRDVIGPNALAEALPANAAFVDFWIYLRFEQDPAKPGNAGLLVTPHYAAFVMSRNGEPTRVDLGPARLINSTVDNWLERINRNAEDPIAERQAASKVRDVAWKQLEPLLAGKTTVYLCPDGVFGRLPFSALPDLSGEKVLLETMKFVEVPHGPGLIGHLRTPPSASKGPVLAIGAVEYGIGAGGPNLQPLPATDLEVASLKLLAGESRIEPVRILTKTDATARNVGAELSTARIAHFATHAKADVPLLAGSETFSRNKLIGCRLALSGANTGSGGVLSGEAIAGLRLKDLDLAVLSACKTAIGPVEIREGVFALRRAFHAAGCKAVVASLWSVDDNCTAALMTRFYYHLWIEHRQPDDAIREAQLDLYRSPRSITEWAEGRRGGAVVLPTAPISIRESLPRKWAGFQISINQP